MTAEEAEKYLKEDESHYILFNGIILKYFIPLLTKTYAPLVYIKELDKYFHIKIVEGQKVVDYSEEVNYR